MDDHKIIGAVAKLVGKVGELEAREAPTAEEIAAHIDIPSAEEIAAQVPVKTPPTAEEVAALVETPSAEDIAQHVSVPTAEEVAEKVVVPQPEDIAKLVKVPEAFEIARLVTPPAPGAQGAPGKDAPPVNYDLIVSRALKKIRVPKDGRDGPTAQEVARLVPPPKQGKRGLKGEQGRTPDVSFDMRNNEIFSIVDGAEESVGKIRLPFISSGGRGVDFPSDGVRFDHKYMPGDTVKANTQVYSGGWLSTSKRKTSETSYPIASGVSTKTPSENYSPIETSDPSVVRALHQYNMTKGGWFNTVEVIVPSVGDDITHTLILVDATDIDNPVARRYPLTNLTPGVYNTVLVSDEVAPEGAVLLITLETIDSGDETPFSGGWNAGFKSE